MNINSPLTEIPSVTPLRRPATSVRRPLALLTVVATLWLYSATADSAKRTEAKPLDPSESEIRIPATGGWEAFLILDNRGVPLWTVEPADIFDSHGCPEVVGLDDKGRAHICVSYSGRWTPTTLISDPKWLGGFAHADVDPRLAGAETYIGAQSGNLYQVVAWPNLVLDYRLIASLPGREIHTLAAGKLDPATPEPEVIAFTVPGGVYLISPTGANGAFQWKHLGDYVGRVRQAIVLPCNPGETPTVVTASRHGRLELLQVAGGKLKWETIYETEMGLGRVAMRPAKPGQALTLYSTLDDGRILRHERQAGASWRSEVIYNGPQGPRGIASGQFDADPETETVIVYGYSKKVELVSRRSGSWEAETLLEDMDKGHWLAAAEVDGRNNTREVVCTGYGGRIFYLTRPPGYGQKALAMSTTRFDEGQLCNFDTEKTGEMPDGWEGAQTGKGSPRWTVEPDDSAPSQTQVLKQSAVADYPLCIKEAAEIKDGFVEVRFKPLSGEKDQAAGVVWRYRDADNYYVARANALENNVVLYKVVEGKRSPLDIVGRTGGYGVESSVPNNRWGTLRVEFVGTRYRVILNAQPLFEVEDVTFTEPGAVGLWTKADSVTLFDDFRFGPAAAPK